MRMEWLEGIADIIGLVGVGCIVTAYALISAEKVTSRSFSYHMLNLSGALLIIVSLLYSWNTPSFVIEVIWIAISLYGLSRAMRFRYKK